MNTKIKTIGLFAIALLALTALVGSAQADGLPDLTVSSISINPGDTRAEEIVRFYVNENNGISADVCNIGDENAGAFDVCFADDGANIGCVEVASLAAGASTTVSIDWTPTCEKYPVMPGFPAHALPITITVTADCNCGNCPTCPGDGSNGKIAESEEANNALAKFIPTIQYWTNPWTGVVYPGIAGVINNGYKSKNFDCDPEEEPLTPFEYDEIVGGGIAYDVSGTKTTLKEDETSERVHHIDIPDGATVKKARLYLYWYEWGGYKTSPAGCLADLSVKFEGTTVLPDAMYNDQKGFGAFQSTKGTYAYDVTLLVSGSGDSDYTVLVENVGREKTTLLGEMLYVVYEGAPCGQTIQLWTLEGNDYLMQGNVTHPSSSDYKFGVTVEEATATVAFPESIDLSNVASATLVTVVAQGMTPGSNMLFNGVNIKTDAWDSPTEAYPSSKINIESVDVTSNLAASGNNMGFQDTGTGGMQASNAFLVVVEAILPADVEIMPQTVNLKSTDEWITVKIVPPEGYDVEDIEEDTVYLDCKIFRDAALGDGIFKFSRDEVNAYLDEIVTGSNELVELTVTGQLSDGKMFEGWDTVRVIKPGLQH